MIRQAHHERNQTLTVRNELIEGYNKNLFKLSEPLNAQETYWAS
jgi:hypothetical protein